MVTMESAASGLGGQGGAQLTRALERVFEDAQITGELRLNGRKLKDFPKIAAKYDLSDTILADLSKNNFHELPQEVCEFFLLEKLDFYHNALRFIPDSVIMLQTLGYLNLSRNQLTTIPSSLCQLPIQVLILSNNKLVSLPEEIGHMQCLMDLDVSCNEISLLPPHVGDLCSLRSLNVRRNLLIELPEDICELKLYRLDISANRISVLPAGLRLMHTLLELVLDHNPLTSPPAFQCTRGKVHIFKYLDIEAIKEDRKRGVLLESEYKRGTRKPGIGYQNGILLDSRRKRYTLDSGYSTSESGDKRWSQEIQELNGDLEEARKLALRAAEFTKEQRQERENNLHLRLSNSDSLNSSSTLSVSRNQSSIGTPSTLSPGSEANMEDSLSKEEQMKEERKRAAKKLLEYQTNEIAKLQEQSSKSSPGSESVSAENDKKTYSHIQTYKEFKEALKIQRASENHVYRKFPSDGNHVSSPNSVVDGSKPEAFTKHQGVVNASSPLPANLTPEEEFRVKHEAIVTQQRIEAVLAQRKVEEERQKWKQMQKEAVLSYVKQRTSPKHEPSQDHSAANNSPSFARFNGTSPVMYPSTPTNAVKETVDPNFTIRRGLEKAREEQELIDQLRWIIETRLKVSLPEDLASSLMDGVVLCHLANQVRPRSVASIHVPSPAVPKLTMAKCRRNVENFLDACKRLGVPQEVICSSQDVLEEKGLVQIAVTVHELLKLTTGSKHHIT